MWNLTLYAKPDCCLCDDAKKAIEDFSAECELRLEVVDITQNDVLWNKYRYDIPVLLRNGEEIARHHIGVKKLRVLRKRLGD